MASDSTGQTLLITDPAKVKQVANLHYQTIAGSPPTRRTTLQNMTPLWQDIYTPEESINISIYDSLLISPTDEEWSSTISALPNDKATGPSGISYEMIKNLSPSLSEYLKDIVTLCFNSGHIPSQWKDATIYPIPKPTDWNCYLKNTRPICLIETARKLMNKIMTNRLASILSAYNILRGNNYAGLPGGSCHTPIHVLESIIHDSNTYNKPLFIFLQDISKAFDSIDTNMLELAMRHLRIPQGFIKLTLNLFTNRSNRVITANGLSDPYKVKIGIDQGEVIFSLLWVIYIDPLLVALNKNNSLPYIISSTSARPQVDISTLAFMDDTTLISSSLHGLTNMLNIANEFYEMNNTKINFDKAELITNRDPCDTDNPVPLCSPPYQFGLNTSSFSITPYSPNDSFRFLGVWFSLTSNIPFVKKQCRMEYQLFANKLNRKMLTVRQLTYLHNSVLLPKVEYRMMCTILPETICRTIAAPMRKLVKHAGKFSSSLPSSFLHLDQGLQMTDLHVRIIQNHISSLTIRFNSSTTLSAIYRHRLYNLQDTLWTPSHPFDITDFSVWQHTKTFRNDLLCRTLHFAALLNISYDSSTLPLPKHVGSAYALHDKFTSNSRLYAIQLLFLKRMNIRSYAQCVDSSSTHLLPFQTIVKLYASHLKISRPPKWYTFLRSLATTNPNSISALALHAEFCIPIKDTLNKSQSVSVVSHNFSEGDTRKMWLAAKLPTDDIAFGRLNAIQTQNSQLVITHWIPTSSFLEKPTTGQICRPHNLRLTLCPGCQLNNTLVGSLHRRILPSRKKPWPCVFTCSKTNALQISNGPKNPANNVATFVHPMSHYIFAAQSLDNGSLQVYPLTISLPASVNISHQNSLTLKRLSAVIKSSPIISVLLPIASKLELSNTQTHIFYTDDAFSRSNRHSLPTICGSGFVAPSSSILPSQRTQLSFACTNWISAYKAEVMALFVLLLVIPDNTQCKVYSDCQSLINTFYKVKNNLEPAQKYRRPMYPIWNLIIEWLHLRNITLVPIKVKGHSDNTFNQHADELARQGLVSPAFVISPDDIHFSDVALTSFR